MAAEYHCRDCFLAFSVGWNHYQCGIIDYSAETLLVCANCGTCYRVMHAIKPKKPSVISRWVSSQEQPVSSIPDRLFAQPAPLILLEWITKYQESEGKW